jgi:hypothetical protein
LEKRKVVEMIQEKYKTNSDEFYVMENGRTIGRETTLE